MIFIFYILSFNLSGLPRLDQYTYSTYYPYPYKLRILQHSFTSSIAFSHIQR